MEYFSGELFGLIGKKNVVLGQCKKFLPFKFGIEFSDDSLKVGLIDGALEREDSPCAAGVREILDVMYFAC